MPGEISTAVKCQHCGKAFYGPLKGLGFGSQETHGPRFMKFIEELFQHLAKEHTHIFDIAQQRGMELQGYLILNNYITTDEATIDQRNFFRWSLHQQTLKARAQNLEVKAQAIVDEWIADYGFRDYAAHPDTKTEGARFLSRVALKEKIYDALKELQTILEEPDLYKPAEESKVLAPNSGPRLVS